MTQEEKQLLLVDLCGRLPYGVMVRVEGEKYFNETKEPYITNLSLNNYILDYDDVTITPYLRPMSSMTEEENKELKYEIELELQALEGEEGRNTVSAAPAAFEIDFYNKHHIDYRGLIPMGLAIEAPEGIYKIE